MKANKIELNGEVLLDLTLDTATPETVAKGVTFHMADGTPSTGTATMGGGGGGGSSASKKDVNFYDYDGTLLHSYTVAEAQALSELPPLHTQKGLVCQGWNWTLDEIKEVNGAVDAGATYITDDGKTRLYISIPNDDRLTVPLYYYQSKASGVTIDWGDGSAATTIGSSGYRNTTHNYASAGDYVITFTVNNGEAHLGNNSTGILGGSSSNKLCAYQNMLKKVEIGSNVTKLANRAFYNCHSLKTITIPKNVLLSDSCFYMCYSLVSVVLPVGCELVTNSFYYCYSLLSVSIPKSVVVSALDKYVFSRCYALSRIVATIDNNQNSTTTNYIPEGFCSFNNSLTSVVLYGNPTSIDQSAFFDCESLSRIVIPNSVTSIKAGVFEECSSMKLIDFTSFTSVPTLSSSSALKNIATDCEIRVPAALYDEWIAATNWSTYADYIVAV
jgi:hypothetical protein